MAQEARLILGLRMAELEQLLDIKGEQRIEIPSGLLETTAPALAITITERGPSNGGGASVENWLGDLGLLGDRPRTSASEPSLPRRVFDRLTSAGGLFSLDECILEWGVTRPRLQRVLDRFSATGLIQRIPRLDRLSLSVWSALNTQYGRRGSEWLLSKGGLGRLPKDFSSNICKALAVGKFSSEKCDSLLSEVNSEDQMLLLNLLGGRLPLGYRLSGDSAQAVTETIFRRVDRMLSRIQRVAHTLDAVT
jgi:hypothetical protein